MPHIHELIDFSVAAFIVNHKRVLLVDHKELGMWLPVGGHIELDENPDQALFREIHEETGLQADDLTVASQRPSYDDSGVKPLLTPAYVDEHEISATHRHIGLIYFASARHDEIRLEESAHKDIRWFSGQEVTDPALKTRPSVRFYAEKAIEIFT